MEYLTYSLPKDVLWLWCVVVGFIGVFSEEKTVLRFEDEAFPSNMTILNRLITCRNSTWGKFTTPTFTCDDIRVHGLRLAYGYYPGWGVHDLCQETGGNHEFSQLCLKMLKKIGMHHKGIYGAMVNNASCGHIDENRYLLKMPEWGRFPGCKVCEDEIAVEKSSIAYMKSNEDLLYAKHLPQRGSSVCQTSTTVMIFCMPKIYHSEDLLYAKHLPQYAEEDLGTAHCLFTSSGNIYIGYLVLLQSELLS